MKIDGGYILLSKKIVKSDIFKKPPLYLKVWIYLLAKARYSDGEKLKRGQVYVTYKELQDACSYHVGYRKTTPTKKQIFGVLEWLRNPYEGNNTGDAKETMVATTKVTKGMVITIDKYSFYQDSKNYEGNSEENDEGNKEDTRRQRQGNSKVKENKKEDKKEYINTMFEKLWKMYPEKKGKAKISDAKKRQLAEVGEENLIKCIERYKEHLENNKSWLKPQNGSSFFNTGYVDYLDENFSCGESDEPEETTEEFYERIGMHFPAEFYENYTDEGTVWEK